MCVLKKCRVVWGVRTECLNIIEKIFGFKAFVFWEITSNRSSLLESGRTLVFLIVVFVFLPNKLQAQAKVFQHIYS